ncbi:hypothetical protein M885DRAFT_225951 [Pelagophyceae sp. CCMP2097]|nr:hypothetical protein M885DRAFT_225951 [Pelagophyceae sp. CCMP2097]
MRLIGGVLLVVLLCAAEARSHEVCEDVCRGLHCDEFHTECNQAESLFGCKCDGCANCRPEGRRLEAANSTAANSTAPGCAQPCFGDARGCDAFIPLGATCVDLETNEYLQVAMATCDCSGCLLCDEIDAFGPAVDACAGGDGGAVSEISTEAAMTAALAAGAPCTSMVLTGDVALGAAAYFESSVRLVGAAGASRPVLSPASGPHRLVTIVDQAVVSLASVVLRDGYEVSAGGCVFVGGGSKLSLDRVAFENCAAGTVGGGVAGWTSSLLHVARSSFDNNAAGLLGGSVFGHDLAAVVLTGGTRIGRSSAFIGGGVAVVTAARVEMSEESRIEACFGSSSSGGLFAGRGALATLSSGSVIAASHTAGNGGGFFSYISSTVVLEGGCTVANCTSINAGGGGQAYVADVFTASDCTFIGCLAMAGGAGLIVRMTEGYGSGTITNIDFFHCTAPRGSGGGFSLGFASRATLTDLRFVGCTAGQAGGAVAAPYSGIGAMVLLRTSITRCHADGDGGALFLGADFRASIDASTLSDNTAGGDGGAVAAGATSKLAVFGGTRVERNSAGNRGGGLALLPASIAGVQNAVVADNSAFGGGGAVFVGAGATLHLGRAALLSRNVAGSDGGAVDVRGKDALLYVSTSCSFVEVTLDWTLTNSLDAADASVLLDYAGARDARGAPARFVPQNGAVTHFEACLPPGRGYELWAASSRGQTWLQGSWSIKLPPHGGTVASFLEPRLTFVQAVNEYGVQGIGSQTHGALAAAFHLDDDDASFDAAVDGIDAVRIVGNVALAGGGGGVSATKAGRAVVYEALFEANHALTGSGGAFAVGAQSTAVLQSVNAVANVAGRDGGAVRVGMLGVVDIYNSTATANDAGGRGGFAILDRVRTASLRSVTARGNRAADRGGALSLELCDQDPVVVAHSTFQNNSAALSGGALDVQSSFLRVEGATLFAGNSVDAGSGGGVAVRPTGAALALASQPAACVAVLRVVVDWRHNAQRCEVVGAIFGTTHNLDGTCDSVPSSCDPLRTIASATRCAGCTCKENLVGAGESYFSVDRVADGALLPTEAATLFVGEPDAGAAKEFEICLEAGEYKIVAHDRRGAAWFGGTLEATVLDFELEPIHRASAEWSPSGFSTEPVTGRSRRRPRRSS